MYTVFHRIADSLEGIEGRLNNQLTLRNLDDFIADRQFVRIYGFRKIDTNTYDEECLWRGSFEYIPKEYLDLNIYRIKGFEDGSLGFIIDEVGFNVH